ncbi:MAG: hypothetical protein PHN75_11315 [Syntrophales bacterium]|nr:hypothetical protein [Syntrophales bacterium]
MKQCPHCGYERRPIDDQYGIVPQTECPKCGVIYAKVEKYAPTSGGQNSLSGILTYPRYLVRKKVLKLFGEAFHVFDPNGVVVLFVNMKAFRLKEDIRLYSREDMQQELMVIKARNILDFSAAYDVMDSLSGEKVGVLKRKGFQSLIRDEWILMDRFDREIGCIKEDSMVSAIARRMISDLIPESFNIEINGEKVCTLGFEFNPFITKLDVDFSPDVHRHLDKRLGMAAAILLAAIEGRHEGHLSPGSGSTDADGSAADSDSGFFDGGDSGGGGCDGD